MKDLRPVTTEGVRYRLSHSKPSQMEDGQSCRVYCEESEADEAIVEINCVEFRFARASYDATRWEPGLRNFIRALEVAFDQGVSRQKVVIRETLREVIGI